MKKLLHCMIVAGLLLITGCSPSLEAKNIKTYSGTEFLVDSLEMVAQKQEIREEVKPDHPQGYFNHYKKEEGYYYHVISGTIKNTSDQEVNLDMLKVKAEDEKGHVSEAKLVAFNEKMMDFWYSLDGQQEAMFYLFAIVKENHDIPTKYRIYSDEDGTIEEKQENFDICYELNYELPSIEK